jgi:MFS-type transporter involved in bile tolerance (Atg22 family)
MKLSTCGLIIVILMVILCMSLDETPGRTLWGKPTSSIMGLIAIGIFIAQQNQIDHLIEETTDNRFALEYN